MFFTTEGKEFHRVHRKSDVDMTAKLISCTRRPSSVFSVVKPKIKILKAKDAKLVTTEGKELFTEVHRESDVDMTAKLIPHTQCLSSVFSVVNDKRQPLNTPLHNIWFHFLINAFP